MTDEIKHMFNKIAPKYDFLNNLISLFTHFFIKNKAVELLDIKDGSKILDLCTGSGDLAYIVKKCKPSCKIIGADFSDEMLKIARKKHPDIEFYTMDAVELDLPDAYFDYVLMGFGLRNIPDKRCALNEINRVLVPSGKFLHLDFGEKNFISKISDILILFVTKIFSGNSYAYRYLIKSKRDFFKPDELIEYMKPSYFKCIKRKDFLFSVITCEIFEKFQEIT